MKTRLLFVILACLSVVLLSACSGAELTSDAGSTVEPTVTAPVSDTAYPGPDALQPATPAGAYPNPVQNAAGAFPTPTSGVYPVIETPLAPPTAEVVPTGAPSAAVVADLQATDPASFKLAAGKVQLVEFFAFWCGTCRFIAPILQELEAEYGERMNFVYLDIDDPLNDGYKKQLGYRYQPHFFLLDSEGNILNQWQGPITREELQPAIEAALSN